MNEASTESLAEEHRAIEVELDNFAENVAAGKLDRARFSLLKTLIAAHYRREQLFLTRLRTHEPRYAEKLSAQHEEALEIADRLEESLAAGEPGEITYLARRLLAIAQHNIIEEERDAFPLVEGWADG